MIKQLGQIDFGAPDANAEFVLASKTNSKPLFLEAYVPPPLSNLQKFRDGECFLLLGLKGTGKTAVLRDLQSHAKSQEKSVEFLIFRNEILEEKDLLDFDWPILVDDKKIKQTKHYLHCIKRILLSIILKLCVDQIQIDDSEIDDDSDSFFRNFLEKMRSSSTARLVQAAFDTIQATITSTRVDPSKISNGKISTDASRLLKRQNDLILENICRQLKKSKRKIALFVDEIHFAYRDEKTLEQDAMLVRDTILAVINLNERFINERIDCVIYAGFRSEFMDHPLIAAAEVNNALSSYGEVLSWATFPANSNHPMFDIASKRIEHSLGKSFSKSKIADTYFGSINTQSFVEETWSKPRDIIRFFNIAKKMYPNRISLEPREFKAALRSYSSEAWLEIKTAATAFLPPKGIIQLEELLRNLGPKMFKAGFSLTMEEFSNQLEPVYREISAAHTATYSKKHLIQMLFILGIFYTRKHDSSGPGIVYAYHRGNRHPAEDGLVFLHRSVARAFS